MTTKIPKNSSLSTRWWWVRHAPVTSNNGRMYGASDPTAEITTPEAYEGLANLLPRNAICITSALQRTQQTLEAILSRGLPAGQRIVEPDLSEQNFGVWQGQPYERIPDLAAPKLHKYWFTTADHAPPEGESFVDLIRRVTAVIVKFNEIHSGRDIIAVSHGGPIRAALGYALGLSPNDCLGFETGNLSVTRLDYEPGSAAGLEWYVKFTNLAPQSF